MSARRCTRHGEPATACLALACRIEYLATELHNTTESRALYIAEVERLGGQIAAVLAIHAPHCKRCIGPIEKCTGNEDWRAEHDCHNPAPECTVCVASWGDEETEPWPCPTVRALGVDAVTSPGDSS